MINRTIDHAVLKPSLTKSEAESAIRLGIRYNVRSVCVRPCDIDMAVALCRSTDTGVSCVLDFPHGCGGAAAKALLAADYASRGVEEIDMVMNYGAAKGGDWQTVEQEIRSVVSQAEKYHVSVKVILETSELTDDEIERAVELSIMAGAAFVKTSTGFAGQGATPEAVSRMVRAAGGRAQVKASGGIRDYATAKQYLDLGATRLGVGYTSVPAICDAE